MDSTEEKTRRILNFIVEYKTKNGGVPPTIEEIRRGAGISSKSMVAYHLDKLESAGIIENPKTARRRIMIVGETYTPPAWFDAGA